MFHVKHSLLGLKIFGDTRRRGAMVCANEGVARGEKDRVLGVTVFGGKK